MTYGVGEMLSITPQRVFLGKSNKPGAGPMAEWLSSRTPLQAAQCFVGLNPGRTWRCSSNHTEAKSHMPQLEGPTTKEYTTMYWGLWGEKGKIKSLKRKHPGAGPMAEWLSSRAPLQAAQCFVDRKSVV